MSYNITCPHCRTALEVQEQWTGMECECPQCKRNFLIPPPVLKPSPLKMVTPLRPGEAMQNYPQNYESQEFHLYSPWGTLIWSIFIPWLGFWFLKRNYEELGEEKKRRNAAIFFCLGIIMLAVFALNVIISGVLLMEIPAALSIVISLFKILGIPFWIAAIVDSGRFIGLLKKEYSGCTIEKRSTWIGIPALLFLLFLLFLPVWGRKKMVEKQIECNVTMREIGRAIQKHGSDHEYLPEDLDSLGIEKCPSGKKYIYLGKGLKWDDDYDLPILMDAPNAHKNFVNILYRGGHVKGFDIRPGTTTCVEVLNSLHPGLGASESGRIVLKNAAQADKEPDRPRSSASPTSAPPTVTDTFREPESDADGEKRQAEDAEKLFEQGRRYYHGDGVAKDLEQAVEWFRKAAEQGHAKAQLYLALCYAKGLGVAKDPEKAVYWYRKAAEQGFAKAQNNLGFCYAKGEGVAMDLEKAVYWYRKAAEQGDIKAQFALGVCYNNGRGVTKDLEKAVYWYRKAAEQGHAKAQFNLGVCYKNGDGVPKDLEKAVYWYRKAAEQGMKEAQCILGACYGEGVGVPQSHEEEVYWYRKAAEQGHAEAQYFLGVCYLCGEGVAKDLKSARRWLREAAAQGDQRARELLNRSDIWR